MKILKKGICLTGEMIGISTEILFRVSGIGINKIYKKVENGKDKDIEKITKNIGEKASNLIVKESKIIANNANKLADNLLSKTKDITSKSMIKETKFYGDTSYFYNEQDLVNGEFKVCE